MALLFNSLVLDAVSILLAALFMILYFYVTRNFNYWEKRGVYSIRPTPFFGSIANVLLLRESTGRWLARMYKEAAGKRFFGVYFMDKPALVVRDLELVKNILVKDAQDFLNRNFSPQEDLDPLLSKNLFGLKDSKWRHLRVKLSPTFTSGKMKKMFYLVDECGKQLASCLEENALSDIQVNVKETMARYGTDVIATCAFGLNTNAQTDHKCEFRVMMKRAFEHKTFFDKISVILIFILPILARLFRLKSIPADVENFVRNMFWDMVEQRKKTGMTRNDFLDLIIKIIHDDKLRSEDVNDVEEIKQDNHRSIEYSKNDEHKFKMKDDDYVAQAFVFLLAGFETSSSVLSYTLFELALNPGIQENLRNEITTVLNQNGGKLSYEVMLKMTYLEMVISESLRKYPTLAFLDRICSSNYNIPGTEVTIQKGTQVIIPVLGIHTDPEIYPDPEKYDPERFSTENKSRRSPYAHLPFGEGPRICIAMRFGQMQVKTALIHILSNFQVRPCAETPKLPLHYKPGSLVESPKEDIVLVFRKIY